MRQSVILWALAVSMASMGLTMLSLRFEWYPLVGIAFFGTGMVAAFSAIWWTIFHSAPAGNNEVAEKIAQAYANVDSRMHEVAMDTAMRHLRGEFDQAAPLHKILDVLLAPAEMRAAFQATYGAQFDDPSMASARAQWEETWVMARLDSSVTAEPGVKPRS